MAQSSTCKELVQVKQEVIACFVAFLEQEISTNSQAAQSLLRQQCLACSHSLQETS